MSLTIAEMNSLLEIGAFPIDPFVSRLTMNYLPKLYKQAPITWLSEILGMQLLSADTYTNYEAVQ